MSLMSVYYRYIGTNEELIEGSMGCGIQKTRVETEISRL